MIKLRPEEFRSISDYIYSLCAITLDSSKSYLIESRLSNLVEREGCASFSEFLARAKGDRTGKLERSIVDGITTNETLFFRDSAPFDLLRFKIFPEIFDRRRKENIKTPLRIWSAACSTGQEIYSIAIILRELLGDPVHYGCRLVGTDISDEALAKASKGIFSPIEISRGLEESMRSKYFRPVAGGWQLADELRAMASFKRLNLMADFSAMGQFDLVLCRNVAIYFSEKDRISLFTRFQRTVGREGYLMIGSMESLNNINQQFHPHRYQRSVYYRLDPPVGQKLAG